MLNQFAEIPDTIRHKIEFRIADNYGGGGLYYQKSQKKGLPFPIYLPLKMMN